MRWWKIAIKTKYTKIRWRNNKDKMLWKNSKEKNDTMTIGRPEFPRDSDRPECRRRAILGHPSIAVLPIADASGCRVGGRALLLPKIY